METIIGESVDRLVNIDFSGRGVIYGLYGAARALSDKPIVMAAAEMFLDGVKKREAVVIATGFRAPPSGVQETDGVLGAVSLAKALETILNAEPVLVIEQPSKQILAAALNAADVKSVIVEYFPVGRKKAEEKSEEILERYSPALLVAIEKAGRNSRGEYHSMNGLNVTRFHAKIEPLFEKAAENGVPTIALGDGGNEVGMGNIKKAVEKFVPYAKKCRCPCRGGIAAESRVDLLVTAAVSNWAAYGIQTCLAALTRNLKALHKPKTEEKLLKAAVNAGAVDGVTGKRALTVDGLPLKFHKTIVSMLHAFFTSKVKREI